MGDDGFNVGNAAAVVSQKFKGLTDCECAFLAHVGDVLLARSKMPSTFPPSCFKKGTFIKSEERDTIECGELFGDETFFITNASRKLESFKISKCSVSRTRSRGVLVRTGPGTISNCCFSDTAMAAIIIFVDPDGGEGFAVSHIDITDNIFIRSNRRQMSELWPHKDYESFSPAVISVGVADVGGEAEGPFISNIYFSKNKIESMPSSVEPLVMGHCSDVFINGTTATGHMRHVQTGRLLCVDKDSRLVLRHATSVGCEMRPIKVHLSINGTNPMHLVIGGVECGITETSDGYIACENSKKLPLVYLYAHSAPHAQAGVYVIKVDSEVSFHTTRQLEKNWEKPKFHPQWGGGEFISLHKGCGEQRDSDKCLFSIVPDYGSKSSL